MSCKECQESLVRDDWTASMLREAAELQAHIEQCADCRQALADYDRLRDLFTEQADVTPSGGWRLFEDHLSRRLATLAECKPSRRHGWSMAVALAVSLVVGLAGWSLYLLRCKTPAGPAVAVDTRATESSCDLRRLGADDIANRVALFRQVAEVIDGRIGWVALTPNDTELGVSREPITRQHKVLLLRLMLDHNRQPASSTDLVMLSGESATVTVPLGGTRSVRYHVTAAGNGTNHVSLSAEVCDDARRDRPDAILATHLAPVDGEVIRAGTLRTSEGDYRLAMAFANRNDARTTP